MLLRQKVMQQYTVPSGSWPVEWKDYHITLLELFPLVAALETWGYSSIKFMYMVLLW